MAKRIVDQLIENYTREIQVLRDRIALFESLVADLKKQQKSSPVRKTKTPPKEGRPS